MKEEIKGYIMPYQITKTGKLRMLPSTPVETPGVDIGIGVQHWSPMRGPHFITFREGQWQSWGNNPIPDPMTKWDGTVVTEAVLRPQRIENDPQRPWRRRYVHIKFNKSRSAGDFPKLIVSDDIECILCGEKRAYWQAHSYAGGTTRLHTFNFCLNCTFKPKSYRSISKPSGPGKKRGGQYRCRICGERGSDRILYEEMDGYLSYQVPIHDDCRVKIHSIEGKTGLRWWDVPSSVTIEL